MSTVFDIYKKPHPEAAIMDVNPKTAEIMLATSCGNRRHRPSHERFLAGCMLRNEWRVTNQGLGFDKNGRLRDGHHRLNAVMQANVAVPFLVVMGLCEEVYSIVDGNLSRTYGDLLQSDERFGSLCRFAYNRSYVNGINRPSAQQLRVFADGDFGAMAINLIDYAPRRRRFVCQAGITCAAVVWLLEGSHHDYILNQYRALTVEDYEAMSPRIASFNRYLSQSEKIDTNRSFIRALECLNPEKAQNKTVSFREGDDKRLMEFARGILRATTSGGDA